MNILEFSVHTDAEGAEALAAAFDEYAYGGAVVEHILTPEANEPIDTARPFTVRAFLLLDESAVAKLRSLEETAWHFAQLRPISEPRVRELAVEDWTQGWKKHYSVQHIGTRVVIKPSWLEYAPSMNEIVIELDPGMAFGTGLHPTTRLCVRALEGCIRPGVRVLDVGSGSGILAIAAAKLGAGEVVAVDVDPVAVEATRENIVRNRVESNVRVMQGTANVTSSESFDLIVANILTEVIVDIASTLSASLPAKGILITSGILSEKANLVEGSLALVGLETREMENEEDWVGLVSVKK